MEYKIPRYFGADSLPNTLQIQQDFIESMSPTNTSHILLVPHVFWGHIRPFCVLASRLVREQENIVVTCIVAPHVLEKIRAEISRQFFNEPWESSNALQRIRILSPCLSNGVDLFDKVDEFADAYPAAYKTLYESKPITCAVTNTTFNALPAPCAAIVDLLSLAQVRATRAISGHSVPIIACVAAGAAAVIRLFGPESIGGVGDFGARIDAEAARTGLSVEMVGPKIFYQTEGKLVQIPGLPTMYDYEFFPQDLKPLGNRPVYRTTRPGYSVLRECDATIITSSYLYDPVSLGAMQQWFSNMQKEVHVLGPLLPASYSTETQNTEERASIDVEAFLEEMLVQHGKKSVFFISFGTIYWATVLDYLDELIEALIEKNAPFILTYASHYAKISEQQADKIKSSGLGMLTSWSPQQFVLNHPATGWFVTHCGFNGVTESLGSGVPLICWPFGSDQPAAAAHLTQNLNVAFELFQVRTGDGLKSIHRNGLTPKGTREAVGIEIRETIDLCRSAKGQELRRNAAKFKVEYANAWEEDGTARHEMRQFLQKYI